MGSWVALTDSRRLPAKAGVYVVFIDNALSYVGQSLNMRLRLHRGHKVRYCPGGLIVTPWGTTRKFEVKFRLSSQVGDELVREARLIAKLQPPFNTVGVRA